MLVVALLTLTKVALWIYLNLKSLRIFLMSGCNWLTLGINIKLPPDSNDQSDFWFS